MKHSCNVKVVQFQSNLCSMGRLCWCICSPLTQYQQFWPVCAVSNLEGPNEPSLTQQMFTWSKL